jgi:demethylmenaquinone methyltransferase/2-methoxy-6-polyprenyl-1,4-benzoquinol methylase
MPAQARYGHFNWIAPFYDCFFAGADYEALFAHLAMGPGMRLLDLGGGTGRVAAALEAIEAVVLVADPAPGMVAQARAKGLTAVRAQAEALPFATASFDRVLVVDAFHHFADQPMAAAEMVRVLKPDGRLLIAEPDLRRWPVKGVALVEKLLLMQSRFHTPEALGALFTAVGGRLLTIVRNGFSAYIVLTRQG